MQDPDKGVDIADLVRGQGCGVAMENFTQILLGLEQDLEEEEEKRNGRRKEGMEQKIRYRGSKEERNGKEKKYKKQ
jgi:hypothetical protein